MPLEDNITPSEVRNRMREYLDHNLAQRLQDEEYDRHYAMNRSERSTVGGDVKISKVQQRLEDELAIQQRRLANQSITDSDEALARQIYAKFAEDEEKARHELELQLRRDEELAMSIVENDSKTPPSTPSEPALIDLDTPVQLSREPVFLPDARLVPAALPSTSTTFVVPQSVLAKSDSRSRSGTSDSYDDPLPTPPSFAFQNISQPSSGLTDMVEQTSAPLTESWTTNVPLLPSNPFYNDVVQAMSALPSNIHVDDDAKSTYHTRDVQFHTPLTPHNSLAYSNLPESRQAADPTGLQQTSNLQLPQSEMYPHGSNFDHQQSK